MKKFPIIFLFLFCLSTFYPKLVLAKTALVLMPYPLSVILHQGKFILKEKHSIYFEGMSVKRQKSAIARLNAHLHNSYLYNNHLASYQSSILKSVELSSAKNADFQVFILNGKNNKNSENDYVLPRLNDDESYQLSINDQTIKITASSDFGALHGLETLSQLIANHGTLHSLPTLTIVDQPRFKWRGLLIDSVRHFISVTAIKRQLDGMAAAKLNVFHWHLTDDQGWRFASKAYPKLQELAADGLFYSREEMKSVVEYASLLGIRVIPEFDVPGHASAIAVAYPELTSEPNKLYQMERHWGVFEPLLDPSNEKVYQFIDDLVQELTEIFPDEYFHIGGDEIHPPQWNNSRNVQAFMQEQQLKNSEELHVAFNKKVLKILSRHQRKMMGWDEVFQPDLPKDIMVQSWRGLESLSQIASQGYQGLLSTGFYIDQAQATSYHYRNELIHSDEVQLPEFKSKSNANTQWQTWQFIMSRRKGSAVKGSLTLVMDTTEQKLSGYLKLNNNHHKKIDVVSSLQDYKNNRLTFKVDTWMGPMSAAFNLSNVDSLTGQILIGNAPYPVEGSKQDSKFVPKITLLPTLASEYQQNILGGEAALWSEMIDEDNIDLRTWPRLFAIAERFWSAKELTDVEDMYERLNIMDNYGAMVIGLAHQKQQQQGFLSLLYIEGKKKEKKQALESLLVFAQAIEPAHYYTRHHLKFQQDLYHQQAPLNLFVDYLAVESFTLIAMNRWLKQYQTGDNSALVKIQNTLQTWQANIPKLIDLITNNPKLKTLSELVASFEVFNTIALDITKRCLENNQFSEKENTILKAKLTAINSYSSETIIASVPLFERLLASCNQR
ncbi:MAG: family 20 glycosylhydrolase [Colwellia sp.]|nr:family 20 glycosylhydrolase [Colwellia sp.]